MYVEAKTIIWIGSQLQYPRVVSLSQGAGLKIKSHALGDAHAIAEGREGEMHNCLVQ